LTRRRKLLLADDSPTIQKVISLTFGDEGMEVVTAADGREALRRLEDEPPPDVLLADAVMPGPDGYELCERVKRDRRLQHIPVVLLVGTFEPFNEAEARRVGADTVLTKPFQSIRDLVSKVGSLLGGESKPEAGEGEGVAEEGHRELAAEVQTRDREAPPSSSAKVAPDKVEAGADAAATREAPAYDAAPREAFGDDAAGRGEFPHAGAETSFADLGADDELIEARPADAVGGQTSARAGRDAFAEYEDPRVGAPSPSTSTAAERDPFTFEAGAGQAFNAGPSEPARSAYNFAAAEEGVRPAFAAQAAGLSAADDALLDLGQIEPPAAEAAAEADEFVLDLDDDFAAPPAAEARQTSVSFADLVEGPADHAGAMASAAHGERSSASHEEAEAARTPFEFSALPSEAEARDLEVTREVIATDVPPFVGGSNPVGAREFVEPRVVPAGEPVPGTFESAFTDGSVEGDVPRPAPFIPETPAPPQPAFPEPPSTAGYALGEARAGVEEDKPRAELSPETIDAIARRVVELMSDKVVREIAWEVVPELAELLIRRKLDEDARKQ
jgi:CheY-like chemotaxis protein